MEVILNKKSMKNMLFILFALCSLMTINVQATDFTYCDGSNTYPLQVKHLDVTVHSDNKFRTVTVVTSNEDLVLEDAVTGYQIYFTDQGLPKLEEFPFPESLTHGQAFKIDHTHSWPIGRTPTNVTIQIDTQSTLESEKPWICLSFPLNLKACHPSLYME